MFWNNNHKRDELPRLRSTAADRGDRVDNSAFRRSLDLIPPPAENQEREVYTAKYLRQRQLLLSIEGNNTTCCVRISSRKHSSRSALLIFRGRVLGCIYGGRGIPRPLTNGQAFDQMMLDLNDPNCSVETYVIDECVALAAGALFHGNTMEIQRHQPAHRQFEDCLNSLVRSQFPGCVVVNSSAPASILTAYVTDGKITAYSSERGWLLNADVMQLSRMLTSPNLEVVARIFEVDSLDAVFKLTWSPSGTGGSPGSNQEWIGAPGAPSEFKRFAEKRDLRTTIFGRRLSAASEHQSKIRQAQAEALKPPAARGHSHLLKP